MNQEWDWDKEVLVFMERLKSQGYQYTSDEYALGEGILQRRYVELKFSEDVIPKEILFGLGSMRAVTMRWEVLNSSKDCPEEKRKTSFAMFAFFHACRVLNNENRFTSLGLNFTSDITNETEFINAILHYEHFKKFQADRLMEVWESLNDKFTQERSYIKDILDTSFNMRIPDDLIFD